MLQDKKIKEIKKKLTFFEDKLAQKMIGYRGVVHESAVSEIKHSEVMVLKAMVESLKEELKKLLDENKSSGL